MQQNRQEGMQVRRWCQLRVSRPKGPTIPTPAPLKKQNKTNCSSAAGDGATTRSASCHYRSRRRSHQRGQRAGAGKRRTQSRTDQPGAGSGGPGEHKEKQTYQAWPPDFLSPGFLMRGRKRGEPKISASQNFRRPQHVSFGWLTENNLLLLPCK